MILHFLTIHGGLTWWWMSSAPGLLPRPYSPARDGARPWFLLPQEMSPGCAQSVFKELVEPSTSPQRSAQPLITVAPAPGWVADGSYPPRLSVTVNWPSSLRYLFLFCFTLFLSVSDLAPFCLSVLAVPAACSITSLCHTVNLWSPTW